MKVLYPIKPFLASVLLSATFILAAGHLQAQNLVVNSNFTGGLSTGWSTTSSIEINPQSVYGGPSSVSYVTEMDVEHTMNQKVCVLPGLSYTFTYQATRRPQSGTPANPGIQVKVTGVTSNTNYVNSIQAYTNTSWSPQANTFTVTIPSTVADNQVNIQFFPNNNTSTYGVLIWDIELAPATSNALSITGPSTTGVSTPNTFAVANSPASAKYTWAFSNDASAAASASAAPNGVSWASLGTKTVSVAIANSTCTMATYSKTVAVSTTLPVQWSSFSGSLSDHDAQLTWVTGQESNGRYFIIQRSANGSDFDSIGTVACMNEAMTHTYTFTDKHTPDGALTYRLVHVDLDNSVLYSGIVALDNGATGGAETISVYPNPAVSILHCDFTSEKNAAVSIRVYSSSGVMVMARSASLTRGINQEAINVGGLVHGTYFLQVADAEGSFHTTKTFVRL